ncbi:MAG: hypothetical protein JNJ60_15300 [Rhodocyclaceae bacterium]|nr:hypothetical protein [Rhodocyclaceae bacterium]
MALFSLKPDCPICGASDVRRSHRKNGEEKNGLALRVPYRCRSCRNRFVALNRSRLAGLATFAGFVLLAAGAIRYLEQHLIDLELWGSRLRSLFGMY